MGQFKWNRTGNDGFARTECEDWWAGTVCSTGATKKFDENGISFAWYFKRICSDEPHFTNNIWQYS